MINIHSNAEHILNRVLVCHFCNTAPKDMITLWFMVYDIVQHCRDITYPSSLA